MEVAAPAPQLKVGKHEIELRHHLWPALGKQRTPGDILYWPRTDQIVPFTHWAVYVGRRKVAPDGGSWVEGRCHVTGEELPEAVVHLWGAADSSTRDISSDAVVVWTTLAEVGGSPYDGNLRYDCKHTPMRREQILERVLVALDRKLYEERFGGYHVLGNNCEHFCTWARYGFQQSDQVGLGIHALGTLGGLLLAGPVGAGLGLTAGNFLTKHVRSLRRQQSIEHELAEATATAGPEEEGAEVDWVVDCLVTHVEDWAKDDEIRKENQGATRGKKGGGAALFEDDEEGEEAGGGEGTRRTTTLLTWDSRKGIRLGNLVPPTRDDDGDGDGDAAGSSGMSGMSGSESGRGSGSESESGSGSDSGRGSGSGSGSQGSGTVGGERQSRQQQRRQQKPQQDAGQQAKELVSDLGNLFGAVLGGVISVGGAVVSEIADAHEKHRQKRLERERMEALAAASRRREEWEEEEEEVAADISLSSHPIRPSTVTITEMSDSEDDNAA